MNVNEPLTRPMLEQMLQESPSALIEVILHLQAVVAEQREQIRQLQQKVAELEERNRPPSAPFRLEEQKRKKEPKKPGRKIGHPGHCRAIPQYVDKEEEVKLEAQGCPECGGELGREKPVVQYIEELREVRPHVTRITTYEAKCKRCEKKVRSIHPQQMSVASGCAAVQIGAKATAAAAILKHEIGIGFSKTSRVLELLCGLQTTAGGLAQSFHRASHKLKSEYEHLIEELRQSKVVYTDETSWWVNGPQSLWVFGRAGDKPITVYRVVEHRDRVTFHEVIPPDFKGVLSSDCLSVYDGATDVQQKCYAHHLRAWKTAKKNVRGNNDTGWLEQLRSLLESAMKLKKEGEQMEQEQREQNRRALVVAAKVMLESPRADPAEETIRNRLVKQRDHLFTFLDHEEVEATNNLAERQLRPAIIARKLSCGNRTEAGARTWEILATLAVTARQRAECLMDFFSQRLPLAAEAKPS